MGRAPRACVLDLTSVPQWERGEVKHIFYGARLITVAPLTPGKLHLDGLITDFLLDQTVQAWSLNSLIQ